jgi:hypothetical protein
LDEETGEKAESPIHAQMRERWHGLSALCFSLSATQGDALGWYEAGPLALRTTGSS